MNSQIHIIYNNVLEMLKERKYDNDFIDKFYMNKTFDEIQDMVIKHSVNIHVRHQDENIKIALVKFIFNKFNKGEFDKIYDEVKLLINEHPNMEYNIILITSEKIPHQTEKELILINNNNYVNDKYDKFMYYENFLYKRVLFNPTKHILVPKHIVLTKEEGLEILKTYNTKANKLPIMIITPTSKRNPDPIGMWLGMRKGDICKIIRKSTRSGETITYRYAV